METSYGQYKDYIQENCGTETPANEKRIFEKLNLQYHKRKQ